MNIDKEYILHHVENEMIYKLLEEGQLPIRILQKAISENEGILSKYELTSLMAEVVAFKKSYEKCEKVGHRITHADSFVGPESGSEHLYCGRCGCTLSIRYY